MSFEGLLRKVTFDGAAVNVTEPFDINPETNGTKDINGVERMNDDDWRIVGSQPFTFHDDESILVTIMHKGGGQEVFEDPGTEIWGFNMKTGNRGYRIELEDGASARSVLMTPGEDPLLLVSTDKGLQVRDPRSGRLLRTVEMLEGGTLQSLYEGM
jgi:methylamine dehydrogenase heavy chain